MKEATLPRPTGSWIPWAFVGLFLVVFAVNGIMVFFAFSSWTGLATEDAYEKGLAYNEQIAAAEAQQSLGWQAELSFAPTGAREGRITLKLLGKQGAPLQGAAVSAIWQRPTHEGQDVELALSDHGNGRYRGDVALPLAGQWDLRLRIEHDRGTYRLDRRIMVR